MSLALWWVYALPHRVRLLARRAFAALFLGGFRIRGVLVLADGALLGDGSSSRLYSVCAPPLWRVDRRLRRAFSRRRACGFVTVTAHGREWPVPIEESGVRMPNVPNEDATIIRDYVSKEQSDALDSLTRSAPGRRRDRRHLN